MHYISTTKVDRKHDLEIYWVHSHCLLSKNN